MLKIGDFSRLARVTIKTLRYYDELGLLKPAEIDSFTGYRYYSADQLPRLHRIIALKEMGLSLEEIARLLQDNVSISHILDLLHTKQEAQKRRLEDELERLKWVEDWISDVEKENKLPAYEIILKKIPPIQVVSVNTTLPNTFDIKPVWSKASSVMKEIVDHIIKSNSQIVGPMIVIYPNEISREDNIDCELAFPVSQDVPSRGEIQCKELPGYDQMVTTIHKGGVNSGAPANIALAKWFEINDYQIIGPHRNVVLIDYKIVGPDRDIYFGDTQSSSPPEEFVVEIQLPVERV
ncbi:MAG: MerR family transcriptional regulator [Dehalococcoidales bacterium]|nr:MAG: MerR family transcriptional regulator [Dehalococcoidales bacterium]